MTGDLHLLPQQAREVFRRHGLPAIRHRLLPETDADYFERRGREEQSYAAELTDPLTRDLHRELAGRYSALAAAIREASDRTG